MQFVPIVIGSCYYTGVTAPTVHQTLRYQFYGVGSKVNYKMATTDSLQSCGSVTGQADIFVFSPVAACV